MNKSRFLLLNWLDAGKGLVVSILTASMTTLYNVVNTGVMPDRTSAKSILLSGAAAGLAYIIKNWLTNSNDQLLKPEQPK